MRRFPRCVAPGLLAAVAGGAGGVGRRTSRSCSAPAARTPASQAPGRSFRRPRPLEAASPGTEQDYCSGSGPPELVDGDRRQLDRSCPVSSPSARSATPSARAATTRAARPSSPTRSTARRGPTARRPRRPAARWASTAACTRGSHDHRRLPLGQQHDGTSPRRARCEVSGDLHAQGELHPSPRLDGPGRRVAGRAASRRAAT